MTQEERKLLIKDLCARLPYGVKFQGEDSNVYTLDAANYFALQVEDMVFKPYLRPMSSMTEEEKIELKPITKGAIQTICLEDVVVTTDKGFDYLIAHHFDYRGLIPMGLALEAPEGMYTTE